MISDSELAALLAEAGEAIPTPAGVDAIIAAVRADEPHASTEPEPAATVGRLRSRRFVLTTLSAAAVVALVVSVVVVSSSPTPPPTTFHAAALPVDARAGSSELGLNETPAEIARTPSGAVGQSSNGAAGNTSAPASTSTASSEKIITTGALSLSVPSARLGSTVRELEAIAAALGGYVTRSSVALAGNSRGGTIVLGIPANEFQKAIGRAEALGTVKHLGTTATDVTGQVADLGAQLNALGDARAQLEALLGRAGTIPALLSVENEITATQSQIQQLEAEQRVLANEIDYSSLTVTLAPPSKQVAPPRTGFSKSWHDALTHFVNGISAFVADSGVVLFAALLIGVIAVLLFLLGKMAWSILRRRLL